MERHSLRRGRRDLVDELGGAAEWAKRIGVVPVAAITVSKLRWLADHEPEHAAATAAVCLPHDWLTWRLSGATDVSALRTDRSDASGTGYFSAEAGTYQDDLLELAMRGRRPALPTVLGPHDSAGQTPERCDARARCRATTPPPRWVSAPNPATASSRSALRAW